MREPPVTAQTATNVSAAIVCAYVVVSTAWIAWSDLFLSQLPVARTQLANLQTVKGALFVIVTGALLFLLVRAGLQRVAASEAEARRNLERLSTALDGAKGGVWDLDLDGGELYLSPQMKALIGHGPEFPDSIETWDERIHPEDIDRVHDSRAQLHAGLSSERHAEYRIRHRDGDYRWIDARAHLVEAASAHVRREVGLVLDITEKKRAEAERIDLQQRLVESQRLEALGNTAASMAHDVKNALQPIVLLAGELREEMEAETDQRRSLDMILQAAARIEDLAHKVLIFGRSEQQERQPLPFADVVQDSLRLVRAGLPKGVDLEADMPTAGGHVETNASEIFQAVMNLSTNAVQAMGERGRLRFGLSEHEVDEMSCWAIPELTPGRYVRLTVADDGPGIPDDSLQRIFEPFYTTKTPEHGTGLGLSVVHGIVRGHGGAVIASNHPDGGACFDLYFPCVNAVCGPIAQVPALGSSR